MDGELWPNLPIMQDTPAYVLYGSSLTIPNPRRPNRPLREYNFTAKVPEVQHVAVVSFGSRRELGSISLARFSPASEGGKQ